MDLQRAETLLRKINMLFESLQADEEVSAIERDLMRDHLRRLYDEFTRPASSSPKSPTGGRRAPPRRPTVLPPTTPTTPTTPTPVLTPTDQSPPPPAPPLPRLPTPPATHSPAVPVTPPSPPGP